MQYVYPFDLDTPILEFPGEGKESNFTVRSSLSHVCTFGGTGSGKTSSVGRFFSHKFLQLQYGGLVLTSKDDEKDLWIEYATKANRLQDLIIVEPGGKHFFNIFSYLCHSNRPAGITITSNIVDTLKTVIESSQEKSGHGSDDTFWANALTMLLNNTLDLDMLATDSLNVQDLYNIVMTAPKKEDGATDKSRTDNFYFFFDKVQEKVARQIEAFKRKLSKEAITYFQQNEAAFENAILKNLPDALLLRQLHNFFIESYKNLSEKTKSIVEFTFSGFLFSLLKEPVYSLFCESASTFTPESCFDGKIVILNIPTKLYQKTGRDVQVMIKYIFQKAWEQRNLKENDRPLFIYADEAHEFIHEGDKAFQAACRSKRIAVFYLTQNLAGFYSCMGGAKADYNVKALLGTFSSKIFLANVDVDTNIFSSDLIGSAYQKDKQWSSSFSGNFSSSQSESFKLEKMVRPEEFVGLSTGGPLNNYMVKGYFHRQGAPFKNGTNFKEVYFSQQ